MGVDRHGRCRYSHIDRRLESCVKRLLLNGYLDAEWGASEPNRRARYYTLTKSGRKHLTQERLEFNALVSAIQHVLEKA